MVNVKSIRKSICQIAEYLIEHDLTDLSGGNISVRDNNKIYINERFSGPKKQWKIEEDSIIVTDICKIPIIGDVNLVTREASTHYAIYQAFPDVNAIIHCHPIYMMVYGAAHMDIPLASEGSRVIFGENPITNIEESVPSSQAQAERVVENFKQRRKNDSSASLICNIPFHGIFSASSDLNEALLYVDTANTCAKLLIYRQLMFGNNTQADLSIHEKFTKEDFATMNIFKDVCEPGYVYKNYLGEEARYKSPKNSENENKEKSLSLSIGNNEKLIENIANTIIAKIKEST